KGLARPLSCNFSYVHIALAVSSKRPLRLDVALVCLELFRGCEAKADYLRVNCDFF
ncbi:MAG: hypothetical protein JWO95_3045, partial [Verrucomicrobiales bacterium]|nr:hypothetical protein [Verrucomicrobiales bacterium]